MQTMTSRWTDDRMDDLKHQVDDFGRRMDAGFAGLREELREHRRDMDARFDKVDERFDKVDDHFDKVDERFNRTQEMIVGLHANITRVSVTLLAVTFGLILTKLV